MPCNNTLSAWIIPPANNETFQTYIWWKRMKNVQHIKWNSHLANNQERWKAACSQCLSVKGRLAPGPNVTPHMWIMEMSSAKVTEETGPRRREKNDLDTTATETPDIAQPETQSIRREDFCVCVAQSSNAFYRWTISDIFETTTWIHFNYRHYSIYGRPNCHKVKNTNNISFCHNLPQTFARAWDSIHRCN